MPVVESIAADYQGDVTFLAVAGKASLDATAARANELIPSGNIVWTLDESIWEAYEVFGQPVTFLISHDDVLVANWFGLSAEADIRSALDQLAGSNT